MSLKPTTLVSATAIALLLPMTAPAWEALPEQPPIPAAPAHAPRPE